MILDTALDLLKTKDSFAAIEYLSSQSDVLTAARTYVDITRHFYWQEKNLTQVVVFARAGVQYGLNAATIMEQRYQGVKSGLLANNSETGTVSESDDRLIRDFDTLIAQYEQPIFILLHQWIEDKNEAADLTQEVFIAAYKSRDQFRGDTSVYVWLSQIASEYSRRKANDVAGQLRSVAKGLAYDLASFTWSGWDEPGIAIDAEHLAIGLDAAKTNLRLAHELQKGNLPLTRAYWMLGAQYLANGDLDLARTNFDESVLYAINEDALAEQLLSAGFAQLTQVLASPSDTHAVTELDAIKTKLASVENGPDFVQQIETAQRVFLQ